MDYRRLPPGLAGFVAGQRGVLDANAQNYGIARGILADQMAMEDRAYANALRPLQAEQLRLAIEASRRKSEALARFGGGGAATAPSGAPAPGGPMIAPRGMLSPEASMPGTVPPGAPLPATVPTGGYQRGVLGYQPADLLPLAAAGINTEPLLKIWQAENPKPEISGGYAFDPRRLQHGQPLPRLEVSREGRALQVEVGPDGLPRVAPMAGSIETYTQFRNADEQARARLDPFMGEVDDAGRPIPQTRLGFASRYGGQPAQAAPGGPAVPTIRASAASDAEALRRVTEAEAQGIPASVSGPVPQAGARQGMGLTPGQRSAAETGGREDAQLVSGYRQKIPNLNATLRRLDRLEVLNADDRTYAAAGAELKTQLGSIAQAFGIDVSNIKTASSELYLAQIGELMKDRLASKDYGSGSGVSNLDLIAARQPLPELARTQAGRAQIIAAIRADTERSLQDMAAARGYFDRNLTLRNFRYPSEITEQVQTTRPGDRAGQRAVTRTGTFNGRRVIQYSDGSMEYAQ